MFQIVYQHQDFIIINKPYGISVHKDQAEKGLTQLVAELLNLPQVWLVHRLDKVTSGLLMLALNQPAAAYLSQLFADHKISKTYLALSVQKPKKKQGWVIGDMQKARGGAWKLLKTKENPAITQFISLSCEPNLRLFILKPKTGKTHQLRVAMKSLGSPILGDQLYGKNMDKIDRTYLHCCALSFSYQQQDIQVYCMPQLEEKSGEFFHRKSVEQLISQHFSSIKYEE